MLLGPHCDNLAQLPLRLQRAREWRNWQTRTVQVRVPVRAWGFKSPLAHEIKRAVSDWRRPALFHAPGCRANSSWAPAVQSARFVESGGGAVGESSPPSRTNGKDVPWGVFFSLSLEPPSQARSSLGSRIRSRGCLSSTAQLR